MSNNFQMGHCEDCLMYKCEVASLKDKIEQLENEISIEDMQKIVDSNEKLVKEKEAQQ